MIGWVSATTADWGRGRMAEGVRNTHGGSHSVLHADPTCPHLCENSAPVSVVDGVFWPAKSHSPQRLPWCRSCHALEAPGEWAEKGACAGLTELFFVDEVGGGKPYDSARAICADCPVLADCSAYTLRVWPEEGLWAGMSPHDRKLLKRAAKT